MFEKKVSYDDVIQAATGRTDLIVQLPDLMKLTDQIMEYVLYSMKSMTEPKLAVLLTFLPHGFFPVPSCKNLLICYTFQYSL